MRGFIFGLVWGTIVIAIVAAVISLLAPLPSGPVVRSNTPSESSQPAEPGAESGIGPAGVDADLVNAAPTLPGASESADTLASMAGADTDSGMRPVVGGDSTLTDPDDGDTTRVETGTAITPPAAGATPDAPGQGAGAPDDLGSIAQAPANSGTRPVVGGDSRLTDPVDGDITQVETGTATTLPAAGATPSAPGQGTGAPDDLGSVAQAPASLPEIDSTAGSLGGPTETGAGQGAGVEVNSETPVAPSIPGTAPSAPQGETQLALSTEPAQPVVPTVSQGGSGFGADALVEESVEPADSESEPEALEPRSTALPQAGSDEPTATPRIGTPVVPLTERNSAPAGTAETTRVAPFILYSEPFSNPDNKPLMAIILIDDDQAIGVEALANFPQPLTMAIDPSAPDAAEKMARHRAAGFEVVSLINLPKGATAQDAEVTLAASFAAMPEVVAVLEGPNSGIQGNRSLADQVSAIVEGTGHGLVMQDNGLNTVFKLAVRAGIPAGVVFRDFDGAGQSGAVIRRFLDQAAFRAGQDGGVIMLGRVRPDTVSALLLWALQDRASRVALAPISAVLKNDEAQ